MIVETFREMGECDDCGNESRLPMMVPWIWARIATGVVHDEKDHALGCGALFTGEVKPPRCKCGILCQRCAELRLGREIKHGDFQESIAIMTAFRGVTGRYKRIGDRVREVLRRWP